MRQVVGIGEEFTCPVCGARYVLEVEETTPMLWVVDGEACSHVDLEILPTSKGGWEVYFAEPEPERD